MATYATDMLRWEDWQRDYRLGLILVMPPEQVSRQIDAMRARYDPRSHSICSTHISLTDPLCSEMTPGLEGEIRFILDRIKPFTLHYGKPHASNEHSGIACPITPQEPIDDLKEALHESAAFEVKCQVQLKLKELRGLLRLGGGPEWVAG